MLLCYNVTRFISNIDTKINMSNQKTANKIEQKEEQKLSESVTSNIDEIELDLVTSSQYFKPKPNNKYLIIVDLEKHKIKPAEPNPKFTDSKGQPLKRYEIVITHVNNQKEQIWTIGKIVTSQIIEEIRKGFKVMEVERIGEDRSTIYRIRGIQ